MAHFVLPALIFASVSLVSGAVTVGGVNFALTKVAETAAATPVKTNIKPSYVAVLPPTRADSLDVARTTPVVARGDPTQSTKETTQQSFTHSVAVESLRVRSGPKRNTPQVFALKGGTKVNIQREERGWVLIDTGAGQKGWVYGKLLRPVEVTEAALH